MFFNLKKSILFLTGTLFLLTSPLVLCTADDNDSVLHLKDIREFELKESRPIRQSEKAIYTLKSESNAQYLIKTYLKRELAALDKQEVLNNFASAFILRKIVGDRAPLTYLVKMEDGSIASASRFIKDFITVHDYLKQLALKDPAMAKLWQRGCSSQMRHKSPYLSPQCNINYPPFRKIFCSQEMVEASMLTNFIKDGDSHNNNAGFIVQNGEIINSALIDFDHSLIFGRYTQFQPSTLYYAGIDQALKSLNLICSFDPDCLDELYPLFDELGARPYLDEIKQVINSSLIDFKKQIKACKIAKKILAEDYTEENFETLFDKLIEAGPYLNNFSSENGENSLMKMLYEKNDTMRIVKALSGNQDLVASFVRYCLKNNHKLAPDIILQVNQSVSENIVEKTFHISRTNQDLEYLSVLMRKVLKKNPAYSFATHLKHCSNDDMKRIHDLIKDFLYKENFNVDDLFELNNNESIGGTIYTDTLDKLTIIGLTNPQNIKFDSHISPAFTYQGLLNKLLAESDLQGIETFLASVKHKIGRLTIFLTLLFHAKEFDVIIKILENIDDIEKVNRVLESIIDDCLEKSKYESTDCTNDISAFKTRLNALPIMRKSKNEL